MSMSSRSVALHKKSINRLIIEIQVNFMFTFYSVMKDIIILISNSSNKLPNLYIKHQTRYHDLHIIQVVGSKS
jgi:hypothetical protein